MNLSTSPEIKSPHKTKNQIILEGVKANEEFQLSYLELSRCRAEAVENGIKPIFPEHIPDMRPAPIKKLAPKEQVIECLPSKLTDAQKAMLGVAGF